MATGPSLSVTSKPFDLQDLQGYTELHGLSCREHNAQGLQILYLDITDWSDLNSTIYSTISKSISWKTIHDLRVYHEGMNVSTVQPSFVLLINHG